MSVDAIVDAIGYAESGSVRFGSLAFSPAMKCMIDAGPTKYRNDPPRRCRNTAEYRVVGRYGRAGLCVCGTHMKDLAVLVPNAAALRIAELESQVKGLEQENAHLLKGYNAEEFAYERVQRRETHHDDAQRFVYFAGREGHIKIGVTDWLEKRMRDLSRGGTIMPPGMTLGPVQLLLSHKGGAPLEASLHREFAEYRIAGEWFSEGPRLMMYIERMNARVSRL